MLAPEVIVEAIMEAYVEVDAELRIRAMNTAAERLLRRSRTGAIGQRFGEAVEDAQRAHQWGELADAVKQGRRIDLAVFYPSQYVWHEVKVVPNGQGGAALLMRDVTDRQWMIRREAERVYLRNVFESAPVAITLMRGPHHVIEYVNAFGRRLLGGRPLEGRAVKEALPDLENDQIFTILDEVYAKGIEYQGRDVYVRFDRNGDGVAEDGWFDISYQPARDFDGKVSGVLSLSIEVTDRERNRAVAAADANTIAAPDA